MACRHDETELISSRRILAGKSSFRLVRVTQSASRRYCCVTCQAVSPTMNSPIRACPVVLGFTTKNTPTSKSPLQLLTPLVRIHSASLRASHRHPATPVCINRCPMPPVAGNVAGESGAARSWT